MAFPFAIQLNSELLPHLLAILGLLMTWELHDIEVRAGRITPRPIFKRRTVSRKVSRRLWRWCKGHAGVHMHVLMTPNDERGCKACQLACGKVFSAAAVRRKNFRGPALTCRNPSGCRCELVGLVGNWPEAEWLVRVLRETQEPATLSGEEMSRFVSSSVSSSGDYAGQDRPGLYLLEALNAEGHTPQFAMSRYRSLIRQALEGNQHPYLVPAYLRLSDLLERGHNLAAALSVVDEFLMLVKSSPGPHPPTRLQTKVMSVRRARLLKLLQGQ
jgi:hypothetical protein